MEWVETTAKTIEEAKSIALDQLGVAEDDAEFEILEEPKAGLFGRVRGEARVRGRVKPVQPRQKAERRERRPKAKDEATTAPAAAALAAAETPAPKAPRPPRTPKPIAATASSAAPLEAADGSEGDRAASFLSGLAASFGYASTTQVVQGEGSDIEVQLHGDELGALIGPRGQTLQAVQELTRLVAQPYGRERSGRLHVDVGGYREHRRAALGRFTAQIAEEVRTTGVTRMLEPMSAPDRKVVHDTASSIAGVVSRSEGEDPNRRVVIAPDHD